MRLNSKQIAEFTGATVIVEALDPSQLALGITWDSRDVQEDFVYVALPGERVDGHDFIDEALRKGPRTSSFVCRECLRAPASSHTRWALRSLR